MRLLQAIGGVCTGPVTDRNGATQWISTSDWSSRIRSVCLQASKRNGRTLPLPVYELDDISSANATANRHKKRKLVILSGRKSGFRSSTLDAKHGCGPSDSKICNSHRTTQGRAAAASQHTIATTAKSPLTLLLTHTMHPRA